MVFGFLSLLLDGFFNIDWKAMLQVLPKRLSSRAAYITLFVLLKIVFSQFSILNFLNLVSNMFPLLSKNTPTLISVS